jgi:5'-3' exonuclease
MLIDFSCVLHRSFHGLFPLSCKVGGEEVKTGTLHGFVNLKRNLNRHFPDFYHVFVLDAGHGGREALYEGYKSGRNHNPALHRLDPEIWQFLSYCERNTQIVKSEGYEADDVIAAFTRSTQPHEIGIHSYDGDMFQLVRSTPTRKVFIVKDMKEPKRLWEDDCKGIYGVAPNELLLYRSLVGDSSDSIPPALPRIRKSLAAFLANRYSAPKGVLLETEWQSAQHKKLANPEVLKAWERNYDLMSFKPCPVESVTSRYQVTSKDIVRIADTYNVPSMKAFCRD